MPKICSLIHDFLLYQKKKYFSIGQKNCKKNDKKGDNSFHPVIAFFLLCNGSFKVFSGIYRFTVFVQFKVQVMGKMAL